MPPSRLRAGDEQAVVGTDEEVAARRLDGYRAAPGADARVDDRHVRADRQIGQRAPQHQRAVANVVLLDLVRDVDDQRLGNDVQHDAVADRGVWVAQTPVGEHAHERPLLGARYSRGGGRGDDPGHASAHLSGDGTLTCRVNTIADRGGAKWDQGRALPAHRHAAARPPRRNVGAGAWPTASACRSARSTATSTRWTADAGLPIWQDGGKFGLDRDAFLPPLALTLYEATTLFPGHPAAGQGQRRARHRAYRGVRQARPDPAASSGSAHRGDRRRLFEDAAQPALHEGFPQSSRRVGRSARRRDRVRRRRLRRVEAVTQNARPAARDRAVGADACAVPARVGRGPRRTPDVQARAHPVGVVDARDIRAARGLLRGR